MKYDIKNASGLVFIILILILVLCFLRYYSLKQEKFESNDDDSLFNDKLTKEFEKKWDFKNDCSPNTFKQKMLNYFKAVKTYRDHDEMIRKQNDEMHATYEKYVKSMNLMEEAKQNLDQCLNTM
jgi:hypothetical protein